MDLRKIKRLSKAYLMNETSGHDWLHIERVVLNCQLIMEQMHQTFNRDLVLAAAYTHDLIDEKVADRCKVSRLELRQHLLAADLSSEECQALFDIIDHLSYSSNIEKHHHLSLEGQIVQDADRLDAIGAIGIARTFYYGGSRGHFLYDRAQLKDTRKKILTKESYRDTNNVRQHFDDKLLKLKDLMNTEAARAIASKRHQTMIHFLEIFEAEIEGRA